MRKESKSKSLFDLYNEYLERFPILVNGLQSVVICTFAILVSTYLSNIIQVIKSDEKVFNSSATIQFQTFLIELQSYVLREKSITIPWQEVYIMGFINFFFITPVLFIFGTFLTKLSESLMLPSKKEEGGEKQGRGLTSSQMQWLSVFIDQFLFSPPFNAAIISLRHYGYHGLTDFAYFQTSLLPMLKDVLPSALLYAWCFWIPVKYFMFSSVPVKYHLLVGSCFSFLWNIIFTLILS